MLLFYYCYYYINGEIKIYNFLFGSVRYTQLASGHFANVFIELCVCRRDCDEKLMRGFCISWRSAVSEIGCENKTLILKAKSCQFRDQSAIASRRSYANCTGREFYGG